MEIINIALEAGTTRELTKIFGLGEDGKVYRWNIKIGEWTLYSQLKS